MFEIGWTELMLIGIVALIVIGPKDLPDMFRTMGRFTAKMRSMARDFQRAMDQAAKDSGVNDIAADLKAATSAKSMGLDAVKDAASRFEKWDPLKPAPAVPVKPTVAPAGAVTEVAPTIHAPAARALASATAAKAAVAAKAATAGAAPLTHKAKARPRVAKPTEAAVVAKPAPKPRAPRKPAKDA